MEHKENSFQRSPAYEDQQSKYIGEYVIIYTPNGGSNAGKLIKIVQEYFILNPFQAQKVEDDILKYYLKKQNPGMAIPLANSKIEPTSRKELLESYALINQERKEEKRKNQNRVKI